MAKIPVKKMSDGTTNFFPVSVLNSVFVNKDFEVKNTMGGLTKGSIIAANTSLESLMSRILVDEGLDIETELYKKVDKVEGKALSTNDYTNADKEKVDGLEAALNGKVNVEANKRLMTSAEGIKLAGLENYNDADVRALIDGKVNKVDGKQLSTEDFTTELKTKLDGIDPDSYVVKSGTKQLSDENFTTEHKTKLEGIDLTAYVEKEEGKQLSTNDYTEADSTTVESVNSEHICATVLQAIRSFNDEQKADFKAYLEELLA